MKKILTCIPVILVMTLAACSGESKTASQTDTSAPLTDSSQTPTIDTTETDDFSNINTDSAKLSVLVQDYENDNIAEILSISYDTTQADLEEYGGINPEIESFNQTVNAGVAQSYYNFINKNTYNSIDIRSYPFTSSDYLQVVTTTCNINLDIETEEDLYSYNFDLKNNKFLSINDALKSSQLDKNTLIQTLENKIPEYIKNLYLYPDITIDNLSVAGFLYKQGASGYVTEFLLQAEVSTSSDEADKRNYIFSYIPKLDELSILNSTCLFDPYDMDQIDPPLSYQKNQDTEVDVSNIYDESVNEDMNVEDENSYYSETGLTFDINGLDKIIHGYEEQMYDDTVYYSISQLDPTDATEDAVLTQIKNIMGTEINLTNITEADEYTTLLTYPSWLIVYETGGNEDTRECFDVYVQTENTDFLVHAEVPADFSTDYHDEIFNRYSTLHWVE